MNYRTTLTWRGRKVVTLADIITPDLKVLFFGCNPAQVSVDAGHYHQGGFGRAFWGLLRRFDFIPVGAPPGREDDYLLDRGLGITDIVKKPGPKCSQVDSKDYDHGRPILTELIWDHQPIKVVCAVYKYAMEELLEREITSYGPIGKQLGVDSQFFVLPFPPGQGRNDAVISREFTALHNLAMGT